MAITTNQKPTIYRNLYENTDPEILGWLHIITTNTRIHVFLFVFVKLADMSSDLISDYKPALLPLL